MNATTRSESVAAQAPGDQAAASAKGIPGGSPRADKRPEVPAEDRRKSQQTLVADKRDEGHCAGVPLVIGAALEPAYPRLVALTVPTQTVPTETVPAQSCDIDRDPTNAQLVGARPGMLCGSTLRWVIIACVAGVAALSLVLGLLAANMDRAERATAGRALETIWVTTQSDALGALADSGQWLLRTKAGSCLVAAQIDGVGQLQFVPTDPANPSCNTATITAR